MYSMLILLSNFTFSYFPCSELWTPLSSGTGIWRSNTSSSKGWCACTCNLAVLPAQLQRETSGFSVSLSCATRSPLWKELTLDKLDIQTKADFALCQRTCFVQPFLWFSDCLFYVHRFSVLALKFKPDHLYIACGFGSWPSHSAQDLTM